MSPHGATTASPLRALLVGAGHTHLHVVDRADALRAAGVEVTLLAPHDFHYSGLASATATGALPADAGRIDVAALAARRGVPHVVARMVAHDLDAHTVRTDDGIDVPYDAVSFNLGSAVATDGMLVDDGVIMVKPLERLAPLTAWLDAPSPAHGARITVVGGGPTGLELAGHLAARRCDDAVVRVADRDERPGRSLPPGARRRVVRRLAERGVVFHAGQPVLQVHHDHAVIGGRRLDHDLAVIATGLSAPPIVVDAGLGDHRGIPVRATLQHIDHDDVYAVGDCARFTPRELPKLGVHGVRQGPVLVASLLARVAGATLPTYDPQTLALRILDLGGGTAVAMRGRWWVEGRAALALKRAIDDRWLAHYR